MLHEVLHGVQSVQLAARDGVAQAGVESGVGLTAAHVKLIHKQPGLSVDLLHAKGGAVPQGDAFDHHRPVGTEAVPRIALGVVVLAGGQRAGFKTQHLHGV